MITFVIGFIFAFSTLTPFLDALFNSIDAINTICAVVVAFCVIAGVATRSAYAFAAMFLVILFMVAVPLLAPFASALEIITSVFIGLWFAYTIRHYVITPFMRSSCHKPAWVLALSRFL